MLQLDEVPRPEPRESQVLVRVHATALNRADVLQRKGRYPAPSDAPADIPGLEIAGEVAQAGARVKRWKEGARVFGIIAGGGYAEYAAVEESSLAPIPSGMSYEDAAAVPEAFVTAHDALITQAQMQGDEFVLIHAVGSGVGLAAVQLVRAFKGHALGTARHDDKLVRARGFGMRAGWAVGSDPAGFVDKVMAETQGRGVNVALDLVGGPYLPATVECTALKGRVILIGLLAGRAATVNLGSILSKRITVRGTVLRSRTVEEKAAVMRAFERDVIPLLESGAVRPVIQKIMRLDEAAEAHELMESDSTFGKIVLRIAGSAPAP